MTAATVTGRTYTRTRARGLAAWDPKPDTLSLLDNVLEVLHRERDWWPLTARQIFYRLVAVEQIEKTEKGYTRLSEALNRGRRSGRVPWDALRDDGVVELSPRAWSGVDGFKSTVKGTVGAYQLDRMAGQFWRLEVWVESGGMARQLAGAVEDFSVPVFSSGGFTSTTARYDAACRAIADGRPTTILNVGDHDPSGCSVVDSFFDDLRALYRDLGGEEEYEAARVAITPEQAQQYDAPSAPQKSTDRRGDHMAETWQAEALAPGVLAGIVDDAVRDRVDLSVRQWVLDQEESDRAELRAWVSR